MTISTGRYKTLEALRTDLMIRTGAAAGASFGYPLFEQFLRDAHDQLWWMVEWTFRDTINNQPVNVNEKWYDLPDDCDMEKLERLAYIRQGSSVEYNVELGIDDWMRSVQSSSVPYRFAIRTNPDSPNPNAVQIELYPTPQQTGILRTYYQRSAQRFVEPEDVSSVPDDLVFLMALYNALLHFNKPNAQAVGDQFTAKLANYRAANRRQTIYRRNHNQKMLPEDYAYTIPPG